MRGLIGEPQASTLDNAITMTLSQSLIRQTMEAIFTSGCFINMNTYAPDPIWGNASIDDIVNTRLGAMGVI
jgi:hypothetical protein